MKAYTNAGCEIDVEHVDGTVAQITLPNGAAVLGVLDSVADTHVTFELDDGVRVRAYFDRADCPDAVR